MRSVALWLAFAACVVSASAVAEPTSSDRALATQLFKEGRDLMAQKKYPEACRKLEESQRLDPGGGTLLNLALCHEAEGRTATAWAEFNEALGVARRDARADREKLAQTRMAALEPKLSRLAIAVSDKVAVQGLTVKRDGSDIGRAAWGTAMPIDPGKHRVEVSAPGYEAWSNEIEIAGNADKQVIEVPELMKSAPEPAPAALAPVGPPVSTNAPAPGPVAPAPRDAPAPSPVAPSATSRVPAYVALAIGVVGVGVGSYFGVRALNKRAQSDDACSPRCTDRAVELNDQAKTAADISSVSFAIGAVGLGLGAYFWIDASNSSAATGKTDRSFALGASGHF